MRRPDPPFGAAEESAARRLIELSIEEDGARDDVTTAISIPDGANGAAMLRAREPGVLAGLACIELTLAAIGGGVELESIRQDGDDLDAGEDVARLSGSLATLLTAERTFLNLVCTLSGTATLTERYVQAAGPDCAVLDTRKTWPGYRLLQKYAVRCGGGANHRMGLHDAVMIKDNHRAGGLSLPAMVEAAKQRDPSMRIIVEADDLAEVELALELPIDQILLDNFDPLGVRVAVRLREQKRREDVKLEASGGVSLTTVGEFAESGCDLVSVGALTHSAPSLDLGLDLD